MSSLDPLLLEEFSLSKEQSNHLMVYSACIGLIFFAALASSACLPLVYRLLTALNLLPATAGCKPLGLRRSESNLLNDEYDDTKYASGDSPQASGNPSWKIKSLWIYPIKSCAGVELAQSSVVGTGLEHDRHFTFAHFKAPMKRLGDPSSEKPAPRWEFATMREYPFLANVHANIWLPDPSLPAYSSSLPSVRTQGTIRVSFPCKRGGIAGLLDSLSAWYHGDPAGTAAFTIPYKPTPEQITQQLGTETVKIWTDFTDAVNMANIIPPPLLAELKSYLGCRLPLSLFRCHTLRPVYRDAPRAKELGWQPVASFNDAYPINLLGLSSVRALEKAQQTPNSPPVSARRFRANIILEGTPPFEEEKWKYIEMGGYEYYVVARCVRCKMPNVDPDNGLKHRVEPDRTIRKTRAVDEGAPKGTGCMAMQLVPKLQAGSSIAVGNVVKVMQTGEHVYTPM